jgi:hypothetical protein
MSDLCARQRPMHDVQDFNTHGQSRPANQLGNEALLAALLRITGELDERPWTPSELSDPSAGAQPHAVEPVRPEDPVEQQRVLGGDFAAIEDGLRGEWQSQAGDVPGNEISKAGCKPPNPRAPLLGGDFAAIEAGLLAGLQEQAWAKIADASMPDALPGMDLRSDRSLQLDERLASFRAGASRGHIKSGRRIYAIMLIVFAGMTGLVVSFDLKPEEPRPFELATIPAGSDKAATGSQVVSGVEAPMKEAAIQGTPAVPPTAEAAPQVVSGVEAPMKEAAIQSAPPEPPTAAAAADMEQPAGLPQAEEKPPLQLALSEAHAPAESEAPAAPAPSPEAQTPAVPPSTPLPSISNRVDSTEQGTAPSAASIASQKEDPAAAIPQHRGPMAAKSMTPKAPARVAKISKTGATTVAAKAGGDGTSRRSSMVAKAKPPISNNPAPAPVAAAKAETPATQPNSTAGGAIGFMQTALNSISRTTSKLLELGGIEAESRP